MQVSFAISSDILSLYGFVDNLEKKKQNKTKQKTKKKGKKKKKNRNLIINVKETNFSTWLRDDIKLNFFTFPKTYMCEKLF